MNGIPKIIHYCWFGGQPLPELAIKCIESWETFCPDYKIIRWDESNFDLNYNQYIKEAYELQKWAFVTDVARLKIIYDYGGIYMDTDVELLKSLDDLLEYSGFMGFENSEYINTGLGFGAKKNNLVVNEMLLDYDNIPFIKVDGRTDQIPCPQRNTKVLINMGLQINNSKQIINDMIFLPTEYFCPKDYESGKLRITRSTYSIHHFDGSWQSRKNKRFIKRRYYYKLIFGSKISNYISKVDSCIVRNGVYPTLVKLFNK